MTTYTDVFGSETIPPSQNRYVAVALTADTTFYWPEQATGSNLMADIMEVTPTAAYTMTFPDATLVGTGRDTLVRNLGAYTITLKDAILVAKHNDRTLQYYGGFEYVDKDYRLELGAYVLYSADDPRVAKHINIALDAMEADEPDMTPEDGADLRNDARRNK